MTSLSLTLTECYYTLDSALSALHALADYMFKKHYEVDTIIIFFL